jgi:hypothetical protein
MGLDAPQMIVYAFWCWGTPTRTRQENDMDNLTATSHRGTALAHLGRGQYVERQYVIGTYTTEWTDGPRYIVCVEANGELHDACVGGSYADPEGALAVLARKDAMTRAERDSGMGAPTIIYDNDARPTITYENAR